MENKRIKVFGVPGGEDQQGTPDDFFYYCTDLMYVIIHQPKKNYKVPQIFTVNGEYGPALTLKKCREGFPQHFETFVNGSMINLKNVLEFEKTSLGAKVHFKCGSPIEISDYILESKPWESLLEQAKQDIEDDRWIPTIEFKGRRKKGEAELIRVQDINIVESCEPKANYHVPLYVTSSGNYVEALTLQAYKTVFPKLFPFLNSNLVNVDQVERITDLKYDLVVSFKGSELKTSMGHKYKKYFPELIAK
ncbi:hypothetical protein B2I21_07565 [Chryseobacterium mucoviscidosis]|nr:hypothetical protein B2I21_07565 [Chryseobacterium mucoviscidosis]